MVLFKRRIQRFCEFSKCGKLIVKRDNETQLNFLKRKTCNTECSVSRRKEKNEESDGKKCWCGTPVSGGEIYCCWDHRLMHIKIKQWGIEPTLKEYYAYCERLQAAQRDIDAKFW